MDRRQFLQTIAMAFVASSAQHLKPTTATAESFYDIPTIGNARIIHTCDTHAQLNPVYYREPNVNLGFGDYKNLSPHIVGNALLNQHGIKKDSALAYALSHQNIDELAHKYGRMGGFSHIMTLTEQLRNSAGKNNTLHLDSGDMWQGSATAFYTQGADMVAASNLLGIDAMVGHWEYTYPEQIIRKNIANFNGEFLSQNVFVKEEATFDNIEVYNEDTGHVFKPYSIREIGGNRVAIIGQSFPYTTISNPQRFIPDWTFGIRAEELQTLINHIRVNEKIGIIILLSHNGSDLDVALARKVNGIDFILGGHTHDILYKERIIGNTVIINTGSVGKFVGCLDIDIKNNKVAKYQWRAIPVFANLLPAHPQMQQHIDTVRAPHEKALSEVLSTTDTLLYRRGNFNGTIDQLITDALHHYYDTDIALSPGFRWGPSIASGNITFEDIMNTTAISYPETFSRQMKGSDIKDTLEAIADNLYHEDPFYQQGGDMVRVSGINYTLHPQGTFGNRISDIRLDNGSLLNSTTDYTVSGWATSNLSDGPPIWDVVSTYLKTKQKVSFEHLNQPKLKDVKDNAGIADYPAELLI